MRLPHRIQLTLWAAAILMLAAPLRALAVTADEYYARGLKLYLSGEYKQAAAELRSALQEDTQHAQAKDLLRLLEEVQRQDKPEPGVLSQLTAALETQQQDGRYLKTVLSNAEQRLSTLTSEKSADQETIAQLRKQLSVAQQQIRETEAKLTGELDQAHSSLRIIEEKAEQVLKEFEALEQEKTTLTQQFADTTEALANTKQERDQATAKRDELAKQVEILGRDKTVLSDQLAKAQDELGKTKTERDQLKVARNENEQLKRSLGKAEQDAEQLATEREQLRGQLAELSRKFEGEVKLKKRLDELAKRLADRDDQLQKLRDVNATLDQQYAALEASQKDQEARLKQAQQKTATLADELAKTQEALTVAQNQARKELADTRQQAQQAQNQLTGELEQTRVREQQATKELEALHSTQLDLQERLVATREKSVGLDASVSDLQEAKAALEKSLKERDAQLVEARRKAQDLQQSLEAAEAELDKARKTLADEGNNRDNLLEQLRVAKENQKTFNEQLRDFEAIKAERDKLQLSLNERETILSKLHSQTDSVNRDLESAKHQVESLENEAQARGEQVKIDQKGLEWRVDSLERELQEARASEAKLRAGLEAQSPQDEEQRRFTERLGKKLEERETQLKQAESVIQLLQTKTAQGGISPIPYDPVQDIAPKPEELGQQEVRAGSEPAPPAVDSPIKIYQVNDELDFVVFSMEGMEWAKPGTQLLLVSGDHPVAAVQLTELDSAGFAVAQIIQTIDPGRQIRKGDLLVARPMRAPVGQ